MLNQKGFTVIEMMVIVFIIGILTTIAVPIYSKASDSSNKNACFANQCLLEAAVESYRTGEGEEPINIDALVTKGYLTEVPICPKTKTKYSLDADKKIVLPCDHGSFK